MYKCPLTEPQLNVYLDEISKLSNLAYIMYIKIDIPNSFNKDDVFKAFEKMINVHPILLSKIFLKDEEPWIRTDADISIEYVENPTKEFCESFIYKPFNLEESLCRFLLTKTNNTYELNCVFHHIIFDGYSLSVFSNDFYKLLNKETIIEDRKFLDAAEFDFKLKKTKYLENSKEFFDSMFTDKVIEEVSPSLDTDCNGGIYDSNVLIDANQIKKTISKYVITEKEFFMSVFAFTYSKFTFNDNAYFCDIDNGRENLQAYDAIGMFVRTVPVIIDCSNKSLKDFFKASSNVIYNCAYYKYHPFRYLANKYNLNIEPLFQYMLNQNDETKEVDKKNNLKSDVDNINKTKKTFVSNFEFILWNNNSKYSFQIKYSKKFSKAFIQKFSETFNNILSEFCLKDNLNDIELLSTNDIKLLDSINQTETKLKYKDILEAFNNSCKKHLTKTLLTYKDEKYSYSKCAMWINNLTEKMKKIPKKSNVAILTHRSHYYLLTSLAVLNCGCAYVPIDDSFPDERIKFILKDSNASLLLCTSETAERAKEITDLSIINVSDINFDNNNCELNTQFNSEDVAVVLYTSGSTGDAKASLINRQAVLNICSHYIKQTKFSDKDTYSLYASFVFDIHVVGMCVPFMTGGILDIIPKNVRLNFEELNNHFVSHDTTHTFMTTQAGKIFASMNYKSKLKFLYVGGEYLGEYNPPKNLTMFNIYGPTECLAYVSSIQIDKAKYVSSIGYLGPNTKAYILDKERKRLPFGAIGELYLSGHQLSNGYLNRDKDNKESFFDNTFDGNKNGYERMYKTGDVVRFLPDNTLGFIRRVDTQVKIRGNRIELSEVENCIRQINNVKDVAVLTIEINNNNELIAYVVSSSKNINEEIKSYIKLNKPNYMIPSYIITLDSLPYNVNGKLDKTKLKDISLHNLNRKIKKPKTKLEKGMVKCVSECFNIKKEKIGIDTNLNSLGINSMQAIRLSSLYKKELNLDLSAYDILKNETIIDQINLQKAGENYQEVYFYHKNNKKNLILIHPGQGGVESYRVFSKYLDDSFNVICIDQYNMKHINNPIIDVKETAEKYIEFLNKYQVEEPYILGGWCIGGNIAYEMAVKLLEQGKKIENVLLLDSSNYNYNFTKDESDKIWNFKFKYMLDNKEKILKDMGLSLSAISDQDIMNYCKITKYSDEGLYFYSPSKYKGKATLFKSVGRTGIQYLDEIPKSIQDKLFIEDSNSNYYEGYVLDLKIIPVPFTHEKFVSEESSKFIAPKIKEICK